MKARTKSCRAGHPRIGDNVYISPKGTVGCRPCRSEASRRHAERHLGRGSRDYQRYGQKPVTQINFGGNRELVIQRDGEKCVRCGMIRAEHKARFGRDITVDHKDGRGCNTPAAEKNNDPDNLQTLCLPCHGRKDVTRKVSRPLTTNEVANIKHLKGSLSGGKVGKLYGVNEQVIYHIWRGRLWKHI